MWLITRKGFVSLVEDRDDPDFIRARARRREHLADTFAYLDPEEIIDLGPDAPDYRWHASLPRAVVAAAMASAVMDIDYTSHVKEAVAGTDHVMYSAMMETWRAMYRLQDEPPLTPTLSDLGDIATKVGELADKMLADKTLDDEPQWQQSLCDTLPVYTWENDDDDCMVCGEDLQTGDRYVVLPEDPELEEPEGPAHAQCADDEGWNIEETR